MEAIKIDTTVVMEQYNFDKPITAKIIYDDDEETSEEINTQKKSAQYYRRPSVDLPPSVELNLGQIMPARTSELLKINAENDMLNEAIGYVSAIVETYFNFSRVESLSAADLASLKLKYLETKFFFFKKSLRVAKFLLLPHKSNEPFIQNIIMEVLKKRNLQSNMYQSIRLLYADLLAWTEARLDNEKKDIRAQKRLQLNTSLPNHTVPYLNSENNSVHRKRRFSPHDIIEKISASNKMLRNNSVVNVQSCFPTSNHNNNSIVEQDRTSCQREMQTSEQNIIYPSVVNTAPSNMVYYPTNTKTYYNPQKKNLSESNYLNRATNMQDTQNHSRAQPFRDDSTQSYQEKVKTIVSQNLLDHNLSHLENNGADCRDISRSSISRDSGFMSPDTLISPPESTITNYQDVPAPWQSTTATHEALMPSISSTKRVAGACHVCGTKTKLLCLGCFQYFYCSKSCQNAHWQLHRSSCSRSSSTS